MLPGQRFIEDRIVGALRAWMMVGILLRVTRIRDRFDGLSLVFYSTPWPVLAFCFLLLAVHHYRRAKWHPMRRYSVFTVVALFTWIATSWHSTPPVSTPPDLRIVQWNVARYLDRVPDFSKWLRAQDADIICLSEGQQLRVREPGDWPTQFPGYQVVLGQAGMICLVRGEVLDTAILDIRHSSEASLHRLRIRGRPVTLMQVDLVAQPYYSRRLPLAKIAEIANAHAGGELLIVGDFNTPRESALLDALRGKFRNAFEAAGAGLSETWPSLAPALSIDQIWAGSAWQPLSCWHGWKCLSDHRPVVAEFAAKPSR